MRLLIEKIKNLKQLRSRFVALGNDGFCVGMFNIMSLAHMMP